MNGKFLASAFIIATVVAACHKDPVKPPAPPPGATSLKVKDITEQNLPSPYYHFEYDDSGKIVLLNYQSGLRIYDIKYDGENIVSMENAINPGINIKLEYVYVNGLFVGIKVKNGNGEVIENCIVSYNPSHQLQEIEWDISVGNGDFLIEQTLTYHYYPDGNLMEVVTHNYPIAPQTEAIYTERFENYDDHANADGFSLANNSTHEPILLPGTKIQLNNPRRIIHSGDGINFEINYTYTYDSKGRPVIKAGNGSITNGPDAGRQFETQSTFSYYD